MREIFDRSTAGEPAAQETLDDVARILAQALMAVRALVDPEVIVLGGSIGSRAELVQRVKDIAAALPMDLAVRASSLGKPGRVGRSQQPGAGRRPRAVAGTRDLEPHAQTQHRPVNDHVELVTLRAFTLRVIHGQSAVSDQAREGDAVIAPQIE